MKLATNRYSVVIKGSRKTPFYYGFKTKNDAEEMRAKLEKATGIEHEVIDYKKIKN